MHSLRRLNSSTDPEVLENRREESQEAVVYRYPTGSILVRSRTRNRHRRRQWWRGHLLHEVYRQRQDLGHNKVGVLPIWIGEYSHRLQ